MSGLIYAPAQKPHDLFASAAFSGWEELFNFCQSVNKAQKVHSEHLTAPSTPFVIESSLIAFDPHPGQFGNSIISLPTC